MKVFLIGAGAVGLGVGSALLRAGARVDFVARPEAARALRTSGLERTGLFGEVRLAPQRFEVHETIGALADRAPDHVLVCTKTFSSDEVARELAATRLASEPSITLFHNGWGSAEVCARRLPAERIFNARVITGFRLQAPGRVEVTVHADDIVLGSLFGAFTERLEPLAAAISRGGIPCSVSPSIERDLWAKMLYNCALNPLGALRGVPYGALAECPETRSLMEAVVREVFAVMRGAGFATHWTAADAYLPVFYGELLPPTAAHESSMLQDLRAGRPTEIEALSGAVAELGDRVGVPTPVNAALRDLVLAISARARTRARP